MKRYSSEMKSAIFVVAILALLLAPSASAGSSLEVFIETFGKNVTVIEQNVTQPGFLPGDLGYQVSGEVASSVLYLQSVPDNTNATTGGSPAAPDSPTPFIIEALKVQVSPSGTCIPFLRRSGASLTFPMTISPGVSNSIGITVHFNCSQVSTPNITFTMTVANFAPSSQNLAIEISKAVAPERLGFNMGTFLTIADVAYNGVVLSDWAPQSHTVQVSAGVLSSPFNIWISKPGERQIVRSISIEAKADHCNPYIEGLPTSGLIIGQMPSLAVRF